MTFYLFVIEVFLSILQWPVRVIFEQMLFPDVSLNGTDSQMVLSATSVSALVYHPLKKKTQHQFHVKNTGGSRQGDQDLQGSETKTRELLGGTEGNSVDSLPRFH